MTFSIQKKIKKKFWLAGQGKEEFIYAKIGGDLSIALKFSIFQMMFLKNTCDEKKVHWIVQFSSVQFLDG